MLKTGTYGKEKKTEDRVKMLTGTEIARLQVDWCDKYPRQVESMLNLRLSLRTAATLNQRDLHGHVNAHYSFNTPTTVKGPFTLNVKIHLHVPVSVTVKFTLTDSMGSVCQTVHHNWHNGKPWRWQWWWWTWARRQYISISAVMSLAISIWLNCLDFLIY